MAKYEVDRTSYMDGKLQSNDIVLSAMQMLY